MDRRRASEAQAIERLRAGGVIVYPTETLYGLGANAMDGAAVERVAALKGRDRGKPISVIVASREMAAEVADSFSSAADRLAGAFWPGPMTIVVAARPGLSPGLTGGGGTIGIRWSSHPVACALAAALGGPITATSANPGGLEAPASCDLAWGHFGESVDAYLDGGKLPGGAGSTVVDCTSGRPRVLREGAISSASIERVVA